MRPIRIRTAQPEDAPGIARVHVDSWRTTYRGIVADDVLERLSEERRSAFWRRALGDPENCGVHFVAVDAVDGVVGFASGGPERDGITGYSSELFAIYLLSTYQRRGIGIQLVARVATGLAAAGHSTMLVWVLADNPSRHFYAALGGRAVANKPIDIGPDTFEEVAYGWQNLEALIQRLDSGMS